MNVAFIAVYSLLSDLCNLPTFCSFVLATSSVFRSHKIQRSPQPPAEPRRVVVRPKVQEVQTRLLPHHVTVQRSDRDAVAAQPSHHWAHLGVAQHEITGDRGLAVTSWLKVDRGRDAH